MHWTWALPPWTLPPPALPPTMFAQPAGQIKVRIEGKEYVMLDGDVVHFRFNV